LVGFIAQGLERCVQQFIDQSIEGPFDFLPGPAIDVSQFVPESPQLIRL
jgi:hypothetical protein